MKKKKRFLFDKELNEIEMKAKLNFDINGTYEILLLDREVISESAYDEVSEPKVIKFRKEYAYTPEMWESGTIVVPTSELKKYERK